MAELLLEFFSEEIPARMQAAAEADLKRMLLKELDEARLTYGTVTTYSTPRRLTIVVDDMPTAQPDLKEERRGPRADAPAQAIEGFLRGCGLTRDQLVEREDKKGTFLYAVIEKSGQPVSDIIPAMVEGIVRNFPWPKSQRWGAGTLRWVRPLHSILCLLDGQAVAFDIDGIQAGNMTRGHRFMAPDAFEVSDFTDYQAKLRAAKVLIDPAERREIIKDEAEKLCAAQGLELVDDEGLLREVAGLVEWPVPLLGKVDGSFMALPGEVMVSEMREHQKYFAVRDAKTGKLSPYFVCTSNMIAKDGGKIITAGNERVLAARLYDAKFFWDQDLKQPLVNNLAKMDSIVFHIKLGTLAQRIERMRGLVRVVAPMIANCDVRMADRGAELAKADLVSGMVYEFPDLQGVMGQYYAKAQGEDAAVADAIADHYLPKGPSDAVPTAPVSVVVALAEKVDTLVGFFSIDEKPTGSKDPFALRRAALGVIRLIVENGLRLSLKGLFDRARINYEQQGVAVSDATADLLAFFADRLKVQQRDAGVRHDIVDAVLENGPADDLVKLLAQVHALQEFIATDDGENLLAGYKRAANILRIEEKKDKTSFAGSVDPSLLAEAAEKNLYESLERLSESANINIDGEKYADAMRNIAQLRGPVDRFFDDVIVNSDDANIRNNRLNLLAKIRAALSGIADFEKIEG